MTHYPDAVIISRATARGPMAAGCVAGEQREVRCDEDQEDGMGGCSVCVGGAGWRGAAGQAAGCGCPVAGHWMEDA